MSKYPKQEFETVQDMEICFSAVTANPNGSMDKPPLV